MKPRIGLDKGVQPTSEDPIIYIFTATYYDERGQIVMMRERNTYGVALANLYGELGWRHRGSELPDLELHT